MNPTGIRRWAFPGALALWVGVCGGGFLLLARYQGTPAPDAAAAPRWPSRTSLRLSPSGSTLVLFAHPRCPCTRASLDSLAWTMARGEGRLRAYALFSKPRGVAEGWSRTDLWASAAAIPHVTAFADEEGAEARLFGAATSGQVLLYDARGVLAYAGGITGGRGHAGDNAGRDAVTSLVAGRFAPASGPVYGCSLAGSTAERSEGGSWKPLGWMKATARL